jgi:hypothetical protein
MEGWKQEESLSIYESPNPCGVLIGLPVRRKTISRTLAVSNDGIQSSFMWIFERNLRSSVNTKLKVEHGVDHTIWTRVAELETFTLLHLGNDV